MGTLTLRTLTGALCKRTTGALCKRTKKAKKPAVYEFADSVYRATNGPTPELRRLYESYKQNKKEREDSLNASGLRRRGRPCSLCPPKVVENISDWRTGQERGAR